MLIATLLDNGLRAATIDPAVIDNPHSVVLDRASSTRWQALFEQNPRWVSRQIAYLESHQPDQLLSLLVARLLYRGEPWLRRVTDTSNQPLWRRANLEVRSAILRTLRSHREPILGDSLCQYLVYEDDPGLIASALTDLYLIEPLSVPLWAIRLADPRDSQHLSGALRDSGHIERANSNPSANFVPLPGSVKPGVRKRCLAFLVDIAGIDAVETRQALDWALLHTSGSECNHAISLIPVGAAGDLLTATVLRLAEEFHERTLDPEGQIGLVMAITRLTGTADHDLIAALMELAGHADRAVAATAATALATSLQWKGQFDVSDIAKRALGDPDPAIRNSLLSFLVRLYPTAVSAACPPDSPWSALAKHEEKLAAWAQAQK